MDMYLGLCTGHLLSASLLLALPKVQLQRKLAWNAMLRHLGQDATAGGWTLQPHISTQ